MKLHPTNLNLCEALVKQYELTPEEARGFQVGLQTDGLPPGTTIYMLTLGGPRNPTMVAVNGQNWIVWDDEGSSWCTLRLL